jgi:hypothetical protein
LIERATTSGVPDFNYSLEPTDDATKENGFESHPFDPLKKPKSFNLFTQMQRNISPLILPVT